MERFRRRPPRFILWVDGAGGFWVCLGETVTLGQPAVAGCAEIPILGDLRGRHARIRRDGEEYLIEALGEVRLDGRAVEQVGLLSDGCTVQLARSVVLCFRRPHPLSASARLDFLSGHRTQPSVDAVLLMADTCVLGPKPHSHVVCRLWDDEVVLFRQGDELFCRGQRPFSVDGSAAVRRARIRENSSVVGETFSFSLEPIR